MAQLSFHLKSAGPAGFALMRRIAYKKRARDGLCHRDDNLLPDLQSFLDRHVLPSPVKGSTGRWGLQC